MPHGPCRSTGTAVCCWRARRRRARANEELELLDKERARVKKFFTTRLVQLRAMKDKDPELSGYVDDLITLTERVERVRHLRPAHKPTRPHAAS